jgi:hypothetical protein
MNKMKRKRIVKALLISAIGGVVIAGGIGLYMFNTPHRDVQATNADYSLTSSQIVNEYLADKDAANAKYLSKDGDSKILEIAGVISKISEDYSGQNVVLLKAIGDKAGVSATFTAETNIKAANLKIGEKITVKGVIRSGASYDEDLELYEHVILDKSDLVKK